MRIGLDLDGLLDERPDFSAFLTAALRSAGHFVAVLTYRDHVSRSKTEAQLSGWGIVHDELHFARSLSDKGRLSDQIECNSASSAMQSGSTYSAIDSSTYR